MRCGLQSRRCAREAAMRLPPGCASRVTPSCNAVLESGLAELGLQACLGTAPTARASLWRARGGGASLHALPVSVIGADEAFFASIGVSTIGGLLALPREGLARRCGQGLINELDR